MKSLRPNLLGPGLLCLSLSLSLGCEVGSTPLGEFDEGGSTTTNAASSSSTGEPELEDDAEEADSSSDSGTTDPTAGATSGTIMCGERSGCSTAHDCFDPGCFGALDDSLDIDGCPRPTCSTDDDCLADEVCFDPAQWGSANGVSGCGDDPETGMCSCFVELSGDGADYCLPDDGVVSADNGDVFCAQFDEQDACDTAIDNLEAGRCGWVQTLEGPADSACGDLLASERCMFLRNFSEASPEATCADGTWLPVTVEIEGVRTVATVPHDTRVGATAAVGDGWSQCANVPDSSVCDCICGD
ncbi:MAG: hypothetical protein AAF799_10280 [Myxococcota bacterium]